jgi:lysophospholipase L1-like esterase
MKTIFLATLALVLQDLPGVKPVPNDGKWMKRHDGFVEEAKKGTIEALFLGDSITDSWRENPAKKIWDERFAPLKAANFGISGDRTQHVLWRIQNGEWPEVAPKAVVLMIGTNNVGGSEPTASASEGIQAIVKEIQGKAPKTKILLLGIFPRSEKPDHVHRVQVKEINTAIAKLDDGGKTVKFLDIGEKFLQPDGTLTKEIMPDFLHLTGKGYQIWADAIQDPLAELLK